MRALAPITTDIVLLGAGHAHVEVLRRFAMRPLPGTRLTLIAREPLTPYSGMLPGLIRGEISVDDAHIDCARLTAAAGARLIVAEAGAIDLAARRVGFASRPDVAYDVLSIDVGGTPAVHAGGLAVKPIGRFLAQLKALEAGLRPGDRIAVVGGGAGGAELALALATRHPGAVTLVSQSPEPVPEAPQAARAALRQALDAAGVMLCSNVSAGDWSDGKLALSDGSVLPAAAALWATGVTAPAFLAGSGLACDEHGCIRVDTGLRSISHGEIFAAGDCAAIDGQQRPKSGVWAVRAGAPLAENLRRAAAGRAPRRWKPQRDALVILGIGHGRAVAWRNGRTFSGRLACWVKGKIDRRWMRMYQSLRPMAADADTAMRCGGCGAKLGPAALADVLAGLKPEARPDIPIGLGEADDAAVALPPPGLAVVQSVDHFRAFLDDPYVFGRIAAAHALSDLHAMGARPWTALAVASVPYSPGTRMRDELAAMMRGAGEILSADGCALVGGHSAEGAETALGFAVTGLADPAAVWRKSGLAPGQALILTKPLGTGIVLAAAMRGEARAPWLLAAIDSMQRSNATAARLLRTHGATACTDVTGFGLAGHLTEMLRASGAGARLDPDGIALLPGARELAARGIASTLAPDNRAALDLPEHALLPLLVDPQTSGGLLAGVPPDRAEACIAAMRAEGLEASRIGFVTGEDGITFGR